MEANLYGSLLTSVVSGLLFIGFGIIIGNLVSILLKKVLDSFETERLLKKIGIQFPVVEALSSLTKYVIYVIGLVLGLTFLGLDEIVLLVILIIVLIILIVFIFIGIKDFIPNFFAGVRINWKKKVKKGEFIVMDSTEGRVQDVGFLETRIKMKDGEVAIIPNTLLTKQMIIKKKKK
tara:strand:- start:238 stop:768 length:531 start_codon:yes stop_codon:yes gene_type:complete